MGAPRSKQPTTPEVERNNNIVHRRQDKLDLLRIGSAGKVGIDRLCRALVEGDEALDNVL